MALNELVSRAMSGVTRNATRCDTWPVMLM